jgi:hypothetical protein
MRLFSLEHGFFSTNANTTDLPASMLLSEISSKTMLFANKKRSSAFSYTGVHAASHDDESDEETQDSMTVINAPPPSAYHFSFSSCS